MPEIKCRRPIILTDKGKSGGLWLESTTGSLLVGVESGLKGGATLLTLIFAPVTHPLFFKIPFKTPVA